MAFASKSADAELIVACRRELQQERERLRTEWLARSNPARLLSQSARVVDAHLRKLWRELGMERDLALLAVGGYGRGELFPASDVDLLLLTPDAPDGGRPSISRLIGLLWDIGLDVGHSVRSIDECLTLANEDISVRTALLEARFLCGDRALQQRFEAAFNADFDPAVFFRAKRLEQQERHSKYDDANTLEPNCKESAGGLRDLQVILWTARAAGLGQRWRELARTQLLSAAEARQLARCEDFLRRVRIGLHYSAGRREDRLLFEHQQTLAAMLDLHSCGDRRAAEVLMQRYHRNARRVGQLNMLLLADLATRLDAGRAPQPTPINADFQRMRDHLDMRREDLFEQRPAAIAEVFVLLSRHADLNGVSTRTLRALWRARNRIDAVWRRNPDNRANFLALFTLESGLTHQLRLMNQFDILGACLPAFGRIVGRMQHDLFHIHTVDRHILQVVRNLRRLTLPEFAHEYPLCSRLIVALPGRWRLYVAALFHDIAKGRGGDHSRLGRRDALRFCRDYGVAAADAELIAFLVEHHLTMSQVAQKEDLSDPSVIARFANLVGDQQRLIALYLLTVCDIRGTSPKVWNAWKARLLEDLFRLSRRLLDHGEPHPAGGVEERQEDARRLLSLHAMSPDIGAAVWRSLDTAYFMRHGSEEIAWHTREICRRNDDDSACVRARLYPAGDGLQVMVYAPDRPVLFTRLCGFFARLGYSIVDARIHTTANGFALDSFVLLDNREGRAYRDMIALINHDLAEHIDHAPPLTPPPQTRLSRQARHLPLEPEVTLRIDEQRRHHVLSVSAADRSGLLYDIAHIFDKHGVRLYTARVATLGERVEDVFLVGGAVFAKTAAIVRLEQELLDILRI